MNNNPLLIGIIIAFLFLVIFFSLKELWRKFLEATCNEYIYSWNLTRYSLESSDRIFGFTEDEFHYGIWAQFMVSLWKLRVNGEFFICRTYEWGERKQTFQLISKYDAEKFIAKYATDKENLIRDWIKREKL